MDKKFIVFVAGSLGSSKLNDIFIDSIKKLKDNYNILFVTGNNYYENVLKQIKSDANLVIKPFVDNLVSVFKVSDLVVTRAGASTISELLALDIPALYIPSPYVANNHQYYNALNLQKQNLAYLITEKDLTSAKLTDEITNIFSDEQTYNTIKKNLQFQKKIKSSEIIYEQIKKIL